MQRVAREAAFCPRCGAAITGGPAIGATRPHPRPLPPPPGARRVVGAADLYVIDESAWGGPRLLDTESAKLTIFNAGGDLRELAFQIRGHDDSGRVLFAARREQAELARGASATLEVASYEISAPTCRLSVALESARSAKDEA